MKGRSERAALFCSTGLPGMSPGIDRFELPTSDFFGTGIASPPCSTSREMSREPFVGGGCICQTGSKGALSANVPARFR
ncbi:hypothetical protein C8J34_101743 [Rhizobium sp. PP-F2F-G36]|nr:hypothetical protein C8J34_101743 [Rhizobium sp. PP-F2F-G36]